MDHARYFAWISRELNADNILKWLGGTSEFIYRWHEQYNVAVHKIAQTANVSGILFPVSIAILVNILGSLIMAAIPFWIGKRAGVKLVDGLLQNHPKFKFLKDTPNKSPFFMSFFVRIIGILPSDIIGLYFGATGIRYKSYITGAILLGLGLTLVFLNYKDQINMILFLEFWKLMGIYLGFIIAFAAVLILLRFLIRNPGNLNAWLKHGDSDKVSLETARRTLRYVEAYGVQSRA